MPADKLDVLKLVWPAPFSTPMPMLVPPSLNVTVPLGVPLPLVTVAVKVTAWASPEGFREEDSVVEVATPFTVWLRAVEVLAAKLASPL